MSAKAQLNNWLIAYSPYVDTLHVYQKDFHQKQKEHKLLSKEFKNCLIMFEGNSDLVLFEMKHASEEFGDIDNLDKESIIRKVKGYITHHGRETVKN